MKRLIKYVQTIGEEGQFSDCSTNYEILPGLFEDSVGPKELLMALKANGLRKKSNAKVKKLEPNRHDLSITHSIDLIETAKIKRIGGTEKHQVRLGFIQLPYRVAENAIDAVNRRVTKKQAHSWIDSGWIGCSNTCEIDDEYYLILDGWEYYHHIRLAGYSLESFERAAGTDETCFNDQVTYCSGCGSYDWESDGYNYNYRIVNGECLGINCGCYDCHAIESIEDFANDPHHAVEGDARDKLEELGRIQKIQTYVGGMTDAHRSHSFSGEHAPVGTPKNILADLLVKEPRGRFIFVHEESGQFQTYFTVYRLVEAKKMRLIQGGRR